MPLKAPLEKEHTYKGRLAHYAEEYGWCFCIGAGVSRGMFRDWNELAEGLVREVLPDLKPADIKTFADAQRPEALIQAAVNLGEGKSNREILTKLSEFFFFGLRAKAGKDWPIIAHALTASKPKSLKLDEWRVFLDFVSDYKDATAPSIAEVIVEALEKDRAPASIISFNAEPLLYALINCQYALRYQKKVAKNNPKILDRLSNDVSRPKKGRIPYYYVHGLLPVPDGRDRFNRTISPTKLVFSETQYLELTRTAYSWQSASFLSECMKRKCVFAGLSFTDPNQRRWLAWEHSGRTSERISKNKREYPSHYWLLKRPHPKETNLSDYQILVAKSVEHLGVRIRWIGGWSSLAEALREMLDLQPKS